MYDFFKTKSGSSIQVYDEKGLNYGVCNKNHTNTDIGWEVVSRKWNLGLRNWKIKYKKLAGKMLVKAS